LTRSGAFQTVSDNQGAPGPAYAPPYPSYTVKFVRPTALPITPARILAALNRVPAREVRA